MRKMKKIITLLLAANLIILTATGCVNNVAAKLPSETPILTATTNSIATPNSNDSQLEPTYSPAALPEPTVAPSPSPADIAATFWGEGNDGIQIDAAPLLDAASRATEEYRFGWDEKGRPSSDIAWQIIYLLINDYKVQIEQKEIETGKLIISKEAMKSLFDDCFAYEFDMLPAISANFADKIYFNEEGYFEVFQTDTEHVWTAREDEKIYEADKAYIVMRLLSGDEKSPDNRGAVIINLLKSPESSFGYEIIIGSFKDGI